MDNLIEYNTNQYPQLTVVIPTYEKHHKYLAQAVASVDFDLAEIIIVNDADIPIEVIGDNISVINRKPNESRWGTGKARNVGAAAANTELLLWLDGDDLFLPNGVKLLFEGYIATKTAENPLGLITYGNFIRSFDNMYWQMQEQYCGADINKSGLVIPAIPYCMLIPKVYHDYIGGYDEVMPTWEDIDYEKKITVAGLCTNRVNSAIFWYRWDSGERRELSTDPMIKKQVSDHMYLKYSDYHEGRKSFMPCTTCGNQPTNPHKPQSFINRGQTPPTNLASNEQLFLIYIGEDLVHTEVGVHTKHSYRIGKSSVKHHFRKRVVDKAVDLANDEVNKLDAENFVSRKKGGRSHEFKYEVEIVVGNTPTPLPTRTTPVPPPSPQIAKNPDLGFVLTAGEPVSDISIPQMQKRIEDGSVFKSQLQTWLEQEKLAEKPRSGMLKVLNEALDTNS